MPKRDEPTVESEMVRFGDAAESPTTESPALSPAQEERAGAKRPMPTGDQTAEVSIDDLGLDLDALEQTGSPGVSGSHLEQTDHPSDAPTMVAGLDERSRRMMQEAESHSHDRDLTELERELEASFISELEASHGSINTSVIPPEAAPTVQMPRASDAAAGDSAATSRVPVLEAHDLDAHEDVHDAALDETHAATATEHRDPDATSRLHLSGDSVDLDLDRLAGALGGGDTVDQPRAAEDIFSSEVFEASQRSRRVDLDLGSSTGSFPKDKGAVPSNSGTYVQPGTGTFIQPGSTGKFAKPGTTILQVEGGAPSEEPPTEFEPVTMSEVGTKLDLARAYMDMGDPEGARSILDEVVQEGSASQKQEAERLLQSLPG
ncbi:MAG: hypothetical protein KGL34_08440 [Gammaproteobacteria bacterium]|nr:hypothetical protein [Gammaproteobacteria bacterium]